MRLLRHQPYQIRTPLLGPHYTLITSLKSLCPNAVTRGLKLQCTDGGGQVRSRNWRATNLTLGDRYGAFKVEICLQDSVVEESPGFPTEVPAV